MTAIEKLISTAKAEVGYLEKKNNSNLDDKTANAGSNNYTKYWRDIKPTYQGQPWCACFVTWCYVQAFGRDMAERLLKHYPYVYCPTMADLFTLNANPQTGDIVIFYNNGTFTHTGIVTSVNGDYFETVEGNTSGGSTIIANGGGVCAKSYYNSNLPGTKFVRPDYSIIESEDELMSAEYDELKAKNEAQDEIINKIGQDIADINAKITPEPVYDYIDDNMPDWARPSVEKAVKKGIVIGVGDGRLGLTETDLKCIVREDRAGMYGE
ncbi:MAG: CHAP domain-containing protein [Eubacterium sp.]